MGGSAGNLIGNVLSPLTFGATDVLLDQASNLLTPDIPTPPSGPTELATGQVAGGASGKAFNEAESESRRRAVSRKRLGTKALRIPLETANSTSGLATSSGGTGIKI